MITLLSKDEQIRDLEKRINNLERKMNKNFMQLDQSFRLFNDVIQKMETENKSLRKERDQLLEERKRLVSGIEKSAKKEPSTFDIIQPVKNTIKNEMDFVRLIARETISETPSDRLYELVILNGKVNTLEAARKLNVRESRIHEWAKSLQQKGFIKIQNSKNETNLIKA
jgi:sugar-specific transcriptional regulator TrmB